MAQNTGSQRAADPRPARTREVLYRAVRELSGEVDREGAGPPVVRIFSIHALVERAGVSRSAFYAQFADLDELMMALLIDTFREIGMADVNARHDPERASSRDLARESLTRLGEHFHERRAFYMSSLGWNVSVRVHQAIVGAFAAQVRETLLLLEEVPGDLDMDDTALYIAGGLIAVLTTWVTTPEPSAIPVLVERLLALLPSWLTRNDLPMP